VAKRKKEKTDTRSQARGSSSEIMLTFTDEDFYRRLVKRFLSVMLKVAPNESRANIDVLQEEISNLLRETALDIEDVVSMRLTGRVIHPTKDAVAVKVWEILQDSFHAVSVEMLDKTLGLFGPDIRRGEKTRSGGKKGQRARFGSDLEKRAARAKFQQTCDDLRARHPDWSANSVYKNAAKVHDVSTRTIRRYVSLKK